jgi:hypothetical protein
VVRNLSSLFALLTNRSELSKPISEVYKHNLSRILENTVRVSSACNEPKWITDCLKVSLRNQGIFDEH